MKKQSLTTSVALFNTQQIKMIEQNYAISTGAGTYPLMEKAGATAFHYLQLTWPDARKIIVVTGKGNNAGDGFIIAKLAIERRIKVDICSLVDTNELSGDARRAFRSISSRAINYVQIDEVNFSNYDVIVDAMLGTGIQGPLREPFSGAIKKINSNPIPVLAVDIPTGVEADTGFVDSEAVRAQLTVTFVGQKKGLYTGDAANYRGRVNLSALEIPTKLYEPESLHLFSQNWHSLKHKLKPRDTTSHKGDYGHSVIIGGNDGMSGASVLAATAAARTGSGLTSAWVRSGSVSALNTRTPEVMALAVDIQEIIKQTASLNGEKHTIVVGPGLGKDAWAVQWLESLSENNQLKNSQQVWDADALNWLASTSNTNKNRYNPHRVLTPHPGEAARLLATSTSEINKDRFSAAQKIAEQYGGICILKGAGTIISDGKGFQIVCPVGNPGMASGGMGDVLAGLVGGLLAQNFSLIDAASLAVSIHGEAADRAAGSQENYRGLLASDLFEYFPQLLNPIQN